MRTVSRRKVLNRYQKDAPTPEPLTRYGQRATLRIKPKSRGKSQIANYSMIEPSKVLKVSKKDVVILKQALEDLWAKFNIREEHRIKFRDLMTKINIYEAAVEIVKEMEQIEKNTEPIQILEKSVLNREDILTKINELIKNEDKEKIRMESTELLLKLRKETHSVLSSLKKWREKLKNNIDFIYTGENYLLKMRSDYFNLIKTSLNEIYDFEQEKSDVVLISPKIIQIESAYFKQKLKTVTDAAKTGKLRVPVSKTTLPKYVKSNKYFENEIKNLTKSPMSDNIEKIGNFPEIQILSLKIKEANLSEFLLNYFKKIPENIISAFGQPNKIIENSVNGINPKWFSFSIKSGAVTSPKGIFTYNKNGDSDKNIINLIHISCLKDLDEENMIQKAINFIFEKENCDEIHIRLYHTQIGEKYQCDQTLEKLFHEKLGFKWLQMVNENPNERYTIFKILKPAAKNNNENSHDSSIKIQTNLFSVKIINFVAMRKGGDKEPAPTQKKQFFWNQSGILTLLSNLEINKGIIKNALLHKLYDFSQNIKEPIIGTKIYGNEELKKTNSLLESQKILLPHEIEESLISGSSDSLCSIFSISGNWQAYSYAIIKNEGKKIKYLRLRQNSTLLFEDPKKGNLILIPAEEQRICLFIYKFGIFFNILLNEKDKMLLEIKGKSQGEFYEYIQEKLQFFNKNKKKGIICNDLWIPGFEYKFNQRIPFLETILLEDGKHIERVFIKSKYIKN